MSCILFHNFLIDILSFLQQIVINHEELRQQTNKVSHDLKSKSPPQIPVARTHTHAEPVVGQKRLRTIDNMTEAQNEYQTWQSLATPVQKPAPKPTTILVPNDVSNEQILEMISKNQDILKRANNGPINIQRMNQSSTTIQGPIGGTTGQFINATPVIKAAPPQVGIPIKIITKNEAPIISPRKAIPPVVLTTMSVAEKQEVKVTVNNA